MEAPDFWDNPERSQKMMKELSTLKEDIEIYNKLQNQKEEIELMIEMGYEENDASVIPDIQEMLETLSEPLWLVCLDLDNFKSINDQYGHDIGDQYLQRFGTMLEEMTKQNGQAYRMGGDEFAVLYSGGPAEKIEALRECCLQSFRDGEKPEFLGVSIGYEQVQDFESLAEVMKRADEMMYVEKRAKQYARGYAAEDTKEVLMK